MPIWFLRYAHGQRYAFIRGPAAAIMAQKINASRIIANLRALCVLEHLLGQKLTFEQDRQFNPPRHMNETDLDGAA